MSLRFLAFRYVSSWSIKEPMMLLAAPATQGETSKETASGICSKREEQTEKHGGVFILHLWASPHLQPAALHFFSSHEWHRCGHVEGESAELFQLMEISGGDNAVTTSFMDRRYLRRMKPPTVDVVISKTVMATFLVWSSLTRKKGEITLVPIVSGNSSQTWGDHVRGDWGGPNGSSKQW